MEANPETIAVGYPFCMMMDNAVKGKNLDEKVKDLVEIIVESLETT